MYERSSRTLKARSNYEQLRLSVSRASDGRRFVSLWRKDKHQGWQYAHLVRHGEYSPLSGRDYERGLYLAAIDLLEEELGRIEARELRD